MAETDPEGVRIRRAAPEDLLQAKALFEELDRYQAAWRVFAPRPDLAEEAIARYRAVFDDPDSVHLVAEDGAALVGMGFGRVQPISSISDERVMEVSNVIVLPSHRRRGVARALIEALAAFAKERGARRLALKTYAQNDDAMRFWESLGFRPRYVQMTATLKDLRRPAT
jgi:ribosomal protein S18 acetylase RimI-like enzyme